MHFLPFSSIWKLAVGRPELAELWITSGFAHLLHVASLVRLGLPWSSSCPAMKGGQGSSLLHLSEIWKVYMKSNAKKVKFSSAPGKGYAQSPFQYSLSRITDPELLSFSLPIEQTTIFNIKSYKKRGRNRSLAVSIWAVGKPMLGGGWRLQIQTRASSPQTVQDFRCFQCSWAEGPAEKLLLKVSLHWL